MPFKNRMQGGKDVAHRREMQESPISHKWRGESVRRGRRCNAVPPVEISVTLIARRRGGGGGSVGKYPWRGAPASSGGKPQISSRRKAAQEATDIAMARRVGEPPSRKKESQSNGRAGGKAPASKTTCSGLSTTFIGRGRRTIEEF